MTSKGSTTYNGTNEGDTAQENANHSEMNHSEMNHSEMKSAPDAANQPYDLQFLDTMTAHHEGAITMLNGILVPTTKTEIHNTASSGIIALGKDIDIMKGWRKEWYGK